MNIVSLWEKIIGRQEESKTFAKQRLQLVLLHDRTDIPYECLDKMKKEIFEVVSKYVDIDLDALDVSLENVDQCVALVANIPIRKNRNLINK